MWQTEAGPRSMLAWRYYLTPVSQVKLELLRHSKSGGQIGHTSRHLRENV